MKLKALIVAKTYPTPARNRVEVSCTQGITSEGAWVRLFPVPFRLLGQAQRFTKYQWIEVDAERGRDSRPESYRINPDTISILSGPLPTAGRWRSRTTIVAPLLSQSMETLDDARVDSGTSLGLVRPKRIEELLITPTSTDWTPEQKAKLAQLSYLETAPYHMLEKIPFDFLYRFVCDDPRCKGHKLRILDWEIAESFRSWRQKYGTDWETKLRERYDTWMREERDACFFVGTHSRWRTKWMITGLFYPPA